MKKFFIDREEPVASVVEKIIGAEDEDIVLVIPRNARIKDSVSNFHLIKRESGSAKKEILIESVDEEVLALAKSSNLNAVHPLFSGRQARSLSDIVPQDQKEGGDSEGDFGKRTSPKKKSKGKRVILKVPSTSPEEGFSEGGEVEGGTPEEIIEDEDFSLEERPKRKIPVKAIAVLGIVIAVILTGVLVLSTLFVKASIKISFTRTPWEYEGEVLATKKTAEVDGANNVIPGEIFTEKRNTTQFFPGSSRASVSQKAKAKLRIYNAYSSQPQTLVATTRFATPDGKVFRLDNQVLVPGAEIKSGKIIPSSTLTTVTADAPGSEYNLDPVSKLTIPGFKGTPKFDGFFGVLEEGSSGGFVGEKAVPTEKDIDDAKKKVTDILRASLDPSLAGGRMREFKILENASNIEIGNLIVNKNTDANGNFSVMGEGSFSAIGFREEDLKNLFLSKAQGENPGTSFRTLDFSYSDIRSSSSQGELRMKVAVRGDVATQFSEEEFKSEIKGGNISSVKEKILQLKGLSDAKVTIWPFWISDIPKDEGKINIEAD